VPRDFFLKAQSLPSYNIGAGGVLKRAKLESGVEHVNGGTVRGVDFLEDLDPFSVRQDGLDKSHR
jgi:hypothetical protein